MTSDYELIDFGNGRKLERFGAIILDRPEIQATGSPVLNSSQWQELASAKFAETTKTKGKWIKQGSVPDSWEFSFKNGKKSWKALLGLSPFKHIGLFPEQAEHWKYLMNSIIPGNRVLNLFGYTGAASLCAASAGGNVFHVDSSKSIVNKAAENAGASDIGGIHWVVEDALAFAKKEVKRGNKYDFIIMDPPVYGRGKKGEHWKLEDLLPDLVNTASMLLSRKGILILNTYSPKIEIDDMVKLVSDSKLRVIRKGWLSVSTRTRKLNLSRFVMCASA
ncbi:class I SAM-dependent methyltransferase [Cryomorphaceae bacterium 1068]|nr:class I SAM-dependent methyltransferase [Cryomorphaceae bacterium 1068]